MSDPNVRLRVALVGNPNSGKTALFNALTGSRQRVANYAGVTVDRKLGMLRTPQGRELELVDLPGTYSLRGRSPDEIVARDVILGRAEHETPPDLLVCVADATSLRLVLRLALELRRTGRPVILALNMMDIARRRGVDIDVEALSAELGVPVIPTVSLRRAGTRALLEALDHGAARIEANPRHTRTAATWREPDAAGLRALDNAVQAIISRTVRHPGRPAGFTQWLDRLVLHPVLGPVILLAVLFFVFQAVFSWAEVPMDLIAAGFSWLQHAITMVVPAGPLRSLLVNGLISGVGAVVVFLPQILILFLFIILLEDFGYMARAAFLMDRTMGRVGLHGRAFIPLLSSFACAIPGIMAARVIGNPRDRLLTTLIAPLMTCSARIPVYTLLIAAFVPRRSVWGMINLQGLVMFGLYLAGIVSAVGVAWLLKRTLLRGSLEPLLLELPDYKLPGLRNLYHGLVLRAGFFLRRAGTIIASAMIVLWFLSSYPAPPAGATGPAIDYSFAGMLGHVLQPALAPVGFNWEIVVALVTGLAAREVMVAALGTVYAVDAATGATHGLAATLAAQWTLPVALALLAWYVFAPQCMSTLAVTQRETNSWRWPAVMAGYMLVLAYVAAFGTFHLARLVTGV
ncbi:MAG TPA: ferrous iron transporter B [Gammaproteobacteria bacterium]|nr:ferrous iron transporter B [Gammaproteobacteria bacterium]